MLVCLALMIAIASSINTIIYLSPIFIDKLLNPINFL